MLEGYALKTALTDLGYDWAAAGMQRPQDYAYYGDLDLYNTWGNCHLMRTRDSIPLEESNAATIEKWIKEAGLEDSFRVENENHWAVGWIDMLRIRLVTDAGEINLPALNFWDNILERLSDYPVLDEEDLSQREWDDTLSTLENCYRLDIVWQWPDLDLPEGWAEDLLHHMNNTGPGISCSEELKWEDIRRAVIQLGWAQEPEDEQA